MTAKVPYVCCWYCSPPNLCTWCITQSQTNSSSVWQAWVDFNERQLWFGMMWQVAYSAFISSWPPQANLSASLCCTYTHKIYRHCVHTHPQSTQFQVQHKYVYPHIFEKACTQSSWETNWRSLEAETQTCTPNRLYRLFKTVVKLVIWSSRLD